MSLKRKYYTGYTIYEDNGNSYPEFKWVTPKEYWAIMDRKRERKEQDKEQRERWDKRMKYIQEQNDRRQTYNRNAYMRQKYRPNEVNFTYSKDNKYTNSNNANINKTVRTAEVIARRRRAALAKKNWLNKYRSNSLNNNKVTKRPITYRKVTVY